MKTACLFNILGRMSSIRLISCLASANFELSPVLSFFLLLGDGLPSRLKLSHNNEFAIP